MTRIAIVLALVLGGSYQIARAQPALADASGSALPPPTPAAAPLGSASAVGSAGDPGVKPSSQIHDPVVSPLNAYNDIKAAKRLGWGLLVLVVLIMACRLSSRLGGFLKPLGTGRVAVVIAAVGTLAVAAYNAVALGGTWMAALSAAVVAGFAYWNSHAGELKP